MLYMAIDFVVGEKALENVDVMKGNKNLFPSPRLFGRNFLGNRRQRELNVRFNIHVTGSIILSDLWYIAARRYQKEF